MLPTALAPCFSDGVAIRYVLPPSYVDDVTFLHNGHIWRIMWIYISDDRITREAQQPRF